MYTHAWGCLGMLRQVQECLGMPRNALDAEECFGTLGNVQKCLGMFAKFWDVQDAWGVYEC